MATCKLCGSDKVLVRSHILPNWAYEPLRDSERKTVVLNEDGGGRPDIRQTGIFDSTLNCVDCEELFAPWDKYGHRFLVLESPHARIISDGGRPIAAESGMVDYLKFKLFLMSVLWRCSRTTRKEFVHCSLGPFEEPLRRMVHDANPGGVDDFTVISSKYIEPVAAGAAMMPTPFRFGAHNGIRLTIVGHDFWIKTDSRSLDANDRTLALSPGRPVMFVLRSFGGSREQQFLRNAVDNWHRSKRMP